MTNYYSSDRSTQLVVALLKAHNISYVIASPGTTNIALVGSMQYDPFFKIYSAADERSAAYMACGLASSTGESVVITCTEATASRNYLPALTEAYYRKLPILVITGHHGEENIGHLSSQTIDRSSYPNDTVRLSVSVNKIHTPTDEWKNVVSINRAILELNHRGGGPVHINLEAGHDAGFNQKELPIIRTISRIMPSDDFPVLPSGRIAIFIGSHRLFVESEINAIDNFCESNNAVVFCDNTSGYRGRFRISSALIAAQQQYSSELLSMDLLIHLGEVSGDTYTTGKLRPKCVWRVSPDGELRDTFKKLTKVFEMDEETFFSYYQKGTKGLCPYLKACKEEYNSIYTKIPEIGFSNIWIAKSLFSKLPEKSVINFSIFNSLRSWNFFQLSNNIESCCNVGGFGIDGPVSTIIGSSLGRPNTLHFLVVGDLAFFYDLNSLGNRHIKNNLRILLVNNGRGIEFRKLDHPGSKFGEDADLFFAAAGHYGNKSSNLVRHYAEDLGFNYMHASNKLDFEKCLETFVTPSLSEKPMVFEVFTQTEDEVKALDTIRNIKKDVKGFLKATAKHAVNDVKDIIK